MADTPRSTSELQTIFANNTSRSISAQDLRDFLVSTYNNVDFPNLEDGTTNASLLTSGTLGDARLSSNVALKNQNNNFSVGQTITGTCIATIFSASSLFANDLQITQTLIAPTTPALTGANLTIRAGEGEGEGAVGGNLTIQAGSAPTATVSGFGGNLILAGGDCLETIGTGGNVTINAGAGGTGEGADGTITIQNPVAQITMSGETIVLQSINSGSGITIDDDSVWLTGPLKVSQQDPDFVLGTLIGGFPIYDSGMNLLGYFPYYSNIA